MGRDRYTRPNIKYLKCCHSSKNLTHFSTWQKDCLLDHTLEVLVTLSSEQQQKRNRNLRLLSMNISHKVKKMNSEKEQVSNWV